MAKFGDINEMTKDQFKKAIEYYEKRIEKIKEDDSIDEPTKQWFINLYNKKIKELKNLLKTLEKEISSEKASRYVNEETATFNSLGKTQTGSAIIEDVEPDNAKHAKQQKRRKIGAILLGFTGIGLIGTIILSRKIAKAKKFYNSLNVVSEKENTDLANFVNAEIRPYEATLGKKGKFSETEMQSLLEDQSEILRLEAILTSGSLNPVEKKNLIEKLVGLKQYAEDNGYTLEPGVLTDPKYETKKEKLDAKISAIETSVNSINDTPTKLDEARERVRKLEEEKEKAQRLLEENPGNAKLQAIIANADTKISNIKTKATQIIENGSNNKIGALNGESVPTSTNVADYTTYDTEIKKAYDKTADYGVSVDEAETIAKELGIPYSKITDVKTRYNELKSENDSKLYALEEKKNKEKEINELINDIKADLKLFDSGKDLNLDSVADADKPVISIKSRRVLDRVKLKLEKLKELTAGDDTYADDYVVLYQTYDENNDKLEAIENTLEASEDGLAEIETHVNGLDADATPDIDLELIKINRDLEYLQSEKCAELFKKMGRTADYAALLHKATKAKETLEARVQEEKDNKELQEEHLNQDKNDIYRTIDYTDIDDMKEYISDAELILERLTREDFRNSLGSDANRTFVADICREASKKIAKCKEEIKKLDKTEEKEELAADIQAAIATLDALLAELGKINGRSSASKKATLKTRFENLKSDLGELKARAAALGVSETKIDAMIGQVDNCLNNASIKEM